MDALAYALYGDGPHVRAVDGLAALMTEDAIDAVRDEETGVWFVPDETLT